MAPKVASPKSTGGGGFVFEDKTCAWLMVCMLTRRAPFAAELGKIECLAFQVLPDGWLLDDVLVTTASHQVALSIRSNTQFRTGPIAPADFVSLAWQQFRRLTPRAFNHGKDRLGLVTSKLPATARRSLDTLTTLAASIDPTTFRNRVHTNGWTTKAVRALYSSFECPSQVSDTASVDPADTARLLACLVFPEHDFEAADSDSVRLAIDECRRALRCGDDAAATSLWESLRAIAAELRPRSGTVTRLDLVRRLLPRYSLADYPDHAPDWIRLLAQSETASGRVRTSLADRFCMNRADEVIQIESAVAIAPHLALVGESGSGKSALARQIFSRHVARGRKALWIDASSLERPDLTALQRDLGLTFSLRELMLNGVDAEPLLVIDGLDRPLTSNAFRLANDLLSLAMDDRSATVWRVVVPCSILEWPRVQGELRKAGSASTLWGEHVIEPLREGHWIRILEHSPRLAQALRNPDLRKALENLKLLDIVLPRLLDPDNGSDSHWLHELNVAETFWSSAIDHGPERIGRGRLVREMAQLQADRILWAVPLDAISAGDGPIASLISDGVITSAQTDALSFQHELYADWARVRILSQKSSELPSFVGTRLQSPLWHRALRLLGAQLLDIDHSAGNWRSVFQGLSAKELVPARDLLVEGAILSRDPRRALEAIKPELLADDGSHLGRLLGRFLIIATLPHPLLDQYAKALGLTPEDLQSDIRVPYWPLWPGLLDFLHCNRGTLTRIAAWRMSEVVSLYQRSSSAQHIYREKVADIALCLAEYALQTRDVHGGDDWYDARRSFYRCLLQAVPERPDAAKPLLLHACQRGPLPPNLSVDLSDMPGLAHKPTRGLSDEQWPAGPGDHIDESFGEVVLERASIIPLFTARPELAEEVLLACLIRPRFRPDGSSFMPLGALRDLHKWFPRSYEHGPFRALLRVDFAQALKIISSLVSFATDRHCARAQQRFREAGREGDQDNTDPCWDVDAIAIDLPTGAHRFRGDSTVFGWSAGIHAPNAVTAALMALEKHLYDQLAAGADVSADVGLILTETNSVAFLKVLCDVGKAEPDLFNGVLLPLFSCPELYAWDEAAVRQSNHGLADILPELAEPETNGELSTFKKLEHRKLRLIDIAARAMLFIPPVAAFFEQVCQQWKVEINSAAPLRRDLLEHVLVYVDRENYAKVSERAYRNVALEALQARHPRQVNEREQRATWSFFHVRCRKLLDDETVLSEPEQADCWQVWTQIRERWGGSPAPDEEGTVEPTDLLEPMAAGIALLLQQPGWHDVNGEKADQCIATLEEAVVRAPFFSSGEDSGFPNALSWSYFCAEALSALWARQHLAPNALRVTGLFLMKASQLAARRLFIGLSGHRQSKALEFEAMRRLAVEWAHIRPVVAALSRRSRGPAKNASLEQRVRETIDAWTASKLKRLDKRDFQQAESDWQILPGWTPIAEAHALLHRQGWEPGPDLEFIKATHDWMPGLYAAQSGTEREGWLTFIREGLDVVLANLSRKLHDKHSHAYPSTGERWLLEQAGVAVLDMTAAELPENLWRPLFALPSRAEEWVCAFFLAFHREALSRPETPRQYTTLIHAFIVDVSSAATGRKQWGYRHGAWDALVGIHGVDERHPPLRDAWEDRHREILERLAPDFSAWMNAVPISAERFQMVAQWLARPAAAPVRLRFLPWLYSSIVTYESHEMPDSRDPADTVARLLNVTWRDQEYALRSNEVGFTAFQGLLTWCADSRSAAALDLQARIATRKA